MTAQPALASFTPAEPAPTGGRWLVDPVGTSPQFTGAEFTPDDLLYAATAEDFVRGEVLPRLEDIERKEDGLMVGLLKRAGELGLLMIDVPERYGGLGLTRPRRCWCASASALCGSFSVSWRRAHGDRLRCRSSTSAPTAQKQRYLPRLATGELLAAYALTEPGSAATRWPRKTRAVLGRTARATG